MKRKKRKALKTEKELQEQIQQAIKEQTKEKCKHIPVTHLRSERLRTDSLS